MRFTYKIFKTAMLLGYLFIVIIASSCKKLAEVEAPFTSTNAGNVYMDDTRAIGVLTGLYTRMSTGSAFTGNGGISLYSGLSADELTLYSGVSDARLLAYYQNALTGNASSSLGSEFWTPLYSYIFTCNSAIEGLNTSSGMTRAVKQQLLGEAKFMRAFFYFYLVNLFGDVPLAISTDYNVNALLARTPKAQVYQQIVSDLKDAQNLLSINYLDANLQAYTGAAERVRPSRWAATALLARVYLYINDYPDAEVQATSVINDSAVYTLDSLNSVFLRNSTEAIWQLQPVNSGRNTEDAQVFILTASGPTTNSTRPVYLSTQLLNKFDSGDQRRFRWVDSVVATGSGVKYLFPSKYKKLGTPVTEYLMLLRLGEQYLIRAEARARQGNTSGAQSDLNRIRQRAGLGNTASNDQASLLIAIGKERQVELFTELGQRWLDLKRTGNVDAVMSVVTPLKASGAAWQSYQQLYPILWSDIEKGPNLKQNTGY